MEAENMCSAQLVGMGEVFPGQTHQLDSLGCQNRVQLSQLRDSVPCRLILMQIVMALKSPCLLGGLPHLTIVGCRSQVEDSFFYVSSAFGLLAPRQTQFNLKWSCFIASEFRNSNFIAHHLLLPCFLLPLEQNSDSLPWPTSSAWSTHASLSASTPFSHFNPAIHLVGDGHQEDVTLVDS